MKNTYRTPVIRKSAMKGVILKEGETIETMVAKFMNNQIDLERTQPLIYTERREGVVAGYDIRTDKWEHAIDATDVGAKQHISKRKDTLTIVKDEEEDAKGEDTKGDSVEGTPSK